MADLELKRVELSSAIELPANDGLLMGLNSLADTITIATPGEFKRGTLLMMDADKNFIPATKAGLSTAKEISILAQDISLGENEYCEAAGYFRGGFSKARVIFPWETEESDHEEEFKSVRIDLRIHGIYLY